LINLQQVYCCWSGFAKVRAEPFRRGLRFRAQQPGECKTSDSTGLLCDDLHRLGFSRALVDAGVLVTPQLELSAQLSNTVKQANRMPYVRRSRWVEVQGAGSPWQLNAEELAQKAYSSIACCEEPASRNSTGVLGSATLGSAVSGAVGDSVDDGAADGDGLGFGKRELSLEQLLAMAAAGGSSAQQQCQAYSLLGRNHTDVFLQQRQQQQQQ
jgi:hypothetical protein